MCIRTADSGSCMFGSSNDEARVVMVCVAKAYFAAAAVARRAAMRLLCSAAER